MFSHTLRILLLLGVMLLTSPLQAEGEWEITPDSEASLKRGLHWLAVNQGPEGNWDSNDLGLVGMGALAFLAAGHAPGRGEYGEVVQRALDYIANNARPSGLLNITSNAQRDMYNHGLATFVLGQAHGMTTVRDQRMSKVLDRALQLIANTQAEDGGWDYQARRQPHGHDLSLVVMQAKALRSAMDSGLDVHREVIDSAIESVRHHYSPLNGRRDLADNEQRKLPGQFTYSRGGGGGSIAMAAAGVVCLQEFGENSDWRIAKNMAVIRAAVEKTPKNTSRNGLMPFDSYTFYYVAQALYQVGGEDWQVCYPIMRDHLVGTQVLDSNNPSSHGSWVDRGAQGGGRIGGKPGQMYATAVACFALAIPNRFLPILQEGEIQSLK